MSEEKSNCCNAKIINGDICSECKEHCVPEEETNEFTGKPRKDVGVKELMNLSLI